MADTGKNKKQPTRQQLLGTAIEVNGVPWYTYKQLAAMYNVTHQTIYNWDKAGRLEKLDHLGLGLTLYRMKPDGSTR